MTGRLTLLGVMLATLPLAVDIPGSGDSTRTDNLQVELAGGLGQFAIVSRGCNGEVLNVTHSQLRSGALVVEQLLPNDFVIGVRAGRVGTTLRTPSNVSTAPGYLVRDSTVTDRYSNAYVNPYAGYEGRLAGVGAGFMQADRPFYIDEFNLHDAHTTWHVRFGDKQTRLVLRWFEDVPLESEGHLSADFGLHPEGRIEMGVFAGLAGPYDGLMLGLRGRVWLTPEAALQIKASASRANGEYGVYGSVIARLPGAR